MLSPEAYAEKRYNKGPDGNLTGPTRRVRAIWVYLQFVHCDPRSDVHRPDRDGQVRQLVAYYDQRK